MLASAANFSTIPLDQVTFTPVAMTGATLTFQIENGKALGLILNHEGHPITLNKLP